MSLLSCENREALSSSVFDLIILSYLDLCICSIWRSRFVFSGIALASPKSHSFTWQL